MIVKDSYSYWLSSPSYRKLSKVFSENQSIKIISSIISPFPLNNIFSDRNQLLDYFQVLIMRVVVLPYNIGQILICKTCDPYPSYSFLQFQVSMSIFLPPKQKQQYFYERNSYTVQKDFFDSHFQIIISGLCKQNLKIGLYSRGIIIYIQSLNNLLNLFYQTSRLLSPLQARFQMGWIIESWIDCLFLFRLCFILIKYKKSMINFLYHFTKLKILNPVGKDKILKIINLGYIIYSNVIIVRFVELFLLQVYQVLNCYYSHILLLFKGSI